MSKMSDEWNSGYAMGVIFATTQKRYIEELLATIAAQTHWLHVARERREKLEDELKQLKAQPVRPTRAALLQPMTGGSNG